MTRRSTPLAGASYLICISPGKACFQIKVTSSLCCRQSEPEICALYCASLKIFALNSDSGMMMISKPFLVVVQITVACHWICSPLQYLLALLFRKVLLSWFKLIVIRLEKRYNVMISLASRCISLHTLQKKLHYTV